jgi:hypothetical protein
LAKQKDVVDGACRNYKIRFVVWQRTRRSAGRAATILDPGQQIHMQRFAAASRFSFLCILSVFRFECDGADRAVTGIGAWQDGAHVGNLASIVRRGRIGRTRDCVA